MQQQEVTSSNNNNGKEFEVITSSRIPNLACSCVTVFKYRTQNIEFLV
jgi:hypothetical protein